MLKILKSMLKNVFSTPFTSKYPVTPYEHFPGTRADVTFDGTTCILCGLCQRSCPSECIKVEREETRIEYKTVQCIRCGVCVRICPVKAISQNEEYTKPSTTQPTIYFTITNENAPIIKRRRQAEKAAAEKAAQSENKQKK